MVPSPTIDLVQVCVTFVSCAASLIHVLRKIVVEVNKEKNESEMHGERLYFSGDSEGGFVQFIF